MRKATEDIDYETLAMRVNRELKGHARGCSIEGCSGKHAAQGYCMRHYTRLVRYPGQKVEQPSDHNPEANEPLTEHEFCILKECRSAGQTQEDVAWELQKGYGVISEAWGHESYALYIRRGSGQPVNDEEEEVE